jgi:chemotaxis protein MotB
LSSGGENTNVEELVIIKRRGGEPDAPHKGGVWKIAYADFMTAMMTFFLVMWLINAADKRTVTQVANYFNPVRLTDKSPSNKGLHDPGAGGSGAEGQQDKTPGKEGRAKGDGETESAKPKFSEEMLFKDPYGVLAKLAANAPEELRIEAKPGEDRQGKAFRDPFDPAQKLEPPQDPADPKTGAEGKSGAEPKGNADTKNSADGKSAADAKGNADVKNAVDGKDKAPAEALGQPRPAEVASDLASKDDGGSRDQDKTGREAARRLAAQKAAIKADADQIDAEIRHVFRRALPGTIPRIDVTVTSEGVLISITDDKTFGMFAVASAEPSPATVVMMENVARILAPRAERLIIRGHTDGRPYRSGNYDNWRLSTARAHVAYFMLARGGIDEKRFERVEGHADRSLRFPSDPEAAQNRRIEILLRRVPS